MTPPGDLYRILGVATTADDGIIRAAYKHLAKTHHPDKGGNPARFIQIQAAYETLTDPNARARYDTTTTSRSTTANTSSPTSGTKYTGATGSERPKSWTHTDTRFGGYVRDGDRVGIHFNKNPHHIPKISPRKRGDVRLHSSWAVRAWSGAVAAVGTYLWHSFASFSQLAAFVYNLVRGGERADFQNGLTSNTLLLWGVAGWVIAAGALSVAVVYLGRAQMDAGSTSKVRNLTYFAATFTGWAAVVYLPRPEVALVVGAVAFIHARNVSRTGTRSSSSTGSRLRG